MTFPSLYGFTLSKALLVAVMAIAGALPAAAQSSGRGQYDARDARYVTRSDNAAVLDYVVCLEGAFSAQPRRLDSDRALDNAIIKCRNEEYRAKNTGGRRDIPEIQQMIRDCGFRPGDARPGMGCGGSDRAQANGDRDRQRQDRNDDGFPRDGKSRDDRPAPGVLPRMDTNGFPVDAVSLGGRVRVGPSIYDEQAGSTLSGQPLQLLGNAGSPYQGFDWFALRLSGGQIAYQWGGSICMQRRPINGIKGACERPTHNAGQNSGGGTFGSGNDDAAAVVTGILDIFSQLTKNKNSPSNAVIEKRLDVVPGGGPARAQGSLNRRQLAIHSISGRKGQTLRVELTSTSDNALLEIFVGQVRDGGRTLRGSGPGRNGTSFEGVLPADGAYKIVVTPRSNATSYRLAVWLDEAAPDRGDSGNQGSGYDPRNDKFLGSYESQTGPAGKIERRRNGLVWTDERDHSFELTVDWANRQLITGDRRGRNFDVDFANGRVTGLRYGRDYYTRSAERAPGPRQGAGNGCDQRNRIVSTSARTGARVTFTNNRNSDVRIYWIGYDGKEGDYSSQPKPLLTLVPNQRTAIDSRLGFAFIAVDRRGECIDVFKTTSMNASYSFDR